MSSATSPPLQLDQMELLVQRRLLSRVRVQGLRMLVHERALIVQGRASTYNAKQLAQHAAMEVSGLPIMANEIEVR